MKRKISSRAWFGVLIILLVATAAAAISADYLTQTVGKGPSGACSSAPRSVSFTIIESDYGPDKGMNGSYYHKLTESWPVMKVCLGQQVTIHILNRNSSETHGFAIDNYFPSGVALAPDDSYTLRFVAKTAGYFRVYCNVLCLIHPEMINGQLVVST